MDRYEAFSASSDVSTNGNTTAMAYATGTSGIERLASITRPSGAMTTYAYDGSGRVESVTNALGYVTTLVWSGNLAALKSKPRAVVTYASPDRTLVPNTFALTKPARARDLMEVLSSIQTRLENKPA